MVDVVGAQTSKQKHVSENAQQYADIIKAITNISSSNHTMADFILTSH